MEVHQSVFLHAYEVVSAQKDALQIFGDTPSEFLTMEPVECHGEQHLPSRMLCMPFEFRCILDHTFRGKTRASILDFHSKWGN